MATLAQVIRDIKSLKIQGAQAIAEAALHAWAKAKDKKKAAQMLIAARPTEPMLQNVLRLANSGKLSYNAILKKLAEKEKIYKIGAKLIRNRMVVFTHCHSSTVVGILKEAKRQGKKFEVRNTETRPLFQGRITARELAKAGIKVCHYIDSAAMQAMRDADIFLFGADAITKEGVYNKIGTEMFAEVASTYFKIPVYSCTHSWKFSKRPIRVEQRPRSEIWKGAPNKIKIYNPAFELAEKRFITGIVSELGILTFDKFLRRVKI